MTLVLRCGDPYQATLALITGEVQPLDLFSITTAQAPRAVYDAHFFCWVSAYACILCMDVFWKMFVWVCVQIRTCSSIVMSLFDQANFAQHDYLMEHTLRFFGPDTKKILAPLVVFMTNKSWAGRAELEVDTNAHHGIMTPDAEWFMLSRLNYKCMIDIPERASIGSCGLSFSFPCSCILPYVYS